MGLKNGALEYDNETNGTKLPSGIIMQYLDVHRIEGMFLANT